MNASSRLATRSGPIVVVDDDETDLYLMERSHRKSGLDNRLVTFDGGPPFLAYVDDLDPSADEVPALVILDINMPGMDGFQVLDELRARDRFRDVPVALFYSNSDSPEDRKRAAEAGCRLQEKLTRTDEGAAFLRSLLDD